ncbi:MAG: Crp/Fnr family transcriptional regulator [Chloroflexi bacterium]|nr:Crp/Fnr family transcriptional regulator [Chloroflexota bacterium]
MAGLISLLDNAEVLGELTTDQKQLLIGRTVRRTLKRDDTVCWQGDPWLQVLGIESGQLRSVIRSLDGRSYVVSNWEAGAIFWPHTLFDGEPMPSTLEVSRDSLVYQWDGEFVLHTVFQNSNAVRALLRQQVRLIRKRRETIADLAFQPVTSRLAKFILERVPASEASAQRDLTLEQIAAMVASSPEVICRTLYQLQKAGMLQVTRASITLQDRAALERLAGAE